MDWKADYTNPEQLFAGGYAGCFHNALNHIIKQEKVKTGDTQVKARVSIGTIENGTFGLAVELNANIADVSMEEAELLTKRAHEVWLYSNGTRGNIEVKISSTNS